MQVEARESNLSLFKTFSFFFYFFYFFSHERVLEELALLKIVDIHLFPDPVGHFGALWWPFSIFEILIEGIIKSKTYKSGLQG